jgi:DnaJ-class molecular chaperone
MFVIANIEIPTRLSGRQKELFEELGRELGGHEHDDGRDDKGFMGKVKEAFGG